VLQGTSEVSAGTTLAPGTSQNITVEADPTVPGGTTAIIEITDGTERVTGTVGAVGIEPNIELSDQSISFTPTRLGDTSEQTVSIANGGNAQLNVTNISLNSNRPGRFTLSPATPDNTTISAGGTETIQVVYQPPITDVSAGKNETEQTATVTIDSDDPDTPNQTIDATGIPQTAALETSGSAVRFIPIDPSSSSERTLTIRNDISATADITLTDVSVIGRDAAAFDADITDQELTPGESTEVNITFEPSQTGQRVAALSVSTNDPRQPGRVVFLSNTQTVIEIRFGSVAFDFEPDSDELPVLPPGTASLTSENTGRITQVQPAVDTTNDFSFTFEENKTDPGPPDNTDDIRSINISTNLESGNFTNNTIEFSVAKTTLNSRINANRTDVELYQFNGSGYQLITTTAPSDSGPDFRYEATYNTSTGGIDNDLLIAVQQPNISDGGVQLALVRTRDDQRLSQSPVLNVGSNAEQSTDFTVNPTRTETFSVESIQGPDVSDRITIDAPNLNLLSADIVTSGPVTTDETVTVDATVNNTGNVSGTIPLTLEEGGTPVDTAQQQIPNNGQNQTVQLSASLSEGTQTLTVTSPPQFGGQSVTAGTITVNAQPPGPGTPVPTPTPEPPAEINETANVTDGEATVTLPPGQNVSETQVSNLPGDVSRVNTVVSATNPSSGSEGLPDDDEIGTFLDITPQDNAGNELSVTQEVTVSVVVEDSTLREINNPALYHDVNSNGTYTELDTQVSEVSNGTQLTATTTGLSPFAVAEATPPTSVVDEFDTDGNGEISITELGQAGQAFASGEISITELGEVGAAFAS
jgi:hypothetical protein